MKFRKYTEAKVQQNKIDGRKAMAINEDYTAAVKELDSDFENVKKVIKGSSITALEVWIELGVKAGVISEKDAQALLAAHESIQEGKETTAKAVVAHIIKGNSNFKWLKDELPSNPTEAEVKKALSDAGYAGEYEAALEELEEGVHEAADPKELTALFDDLSECYGAQGFDPERISGILAKICGCDVSVNEMTPEELTDFMAEIEKGLANVDWDQQLEAKKVVDEIVKKHGIHVSEAAKAVKKPDPFHEAKAFDADKWFGDHMPPKDVVEKFADISDEAKMEYHDSYEEAVEQGGVGAKDLTFGEWLSDKEIVEKGVNEAGEDTATADDTDIDVKQLEDVIDAALKQAINALPGELKKIADGGQLELTPKVDAAAGEGDEKQQVDEAIGALIAGGALALPAILQIVGKAVAWGGSKLDAKGTEKFGKAVEKAGHDLHHKYDKVIDKILSPLTKNMDPHKREIANKLVFYALVATLGGLGASGAIHAAGHGAHGLAAIEGGLSAVKASEIATAASEVIPNILIKLVQAA